MNPGLLPWLRSRLAAVAPWPSDTDPPTSGGGALRPIRHGFFGPGFFEPKSVAQQMPSRECHCKGAGGTGRCPPCTQRSRESGVQLLNGTSESARTRGVGPELGCASGAVSACLRGLGRRQERPAPLSPHPPTPPRHPLRKVTG